MKSRDTAIRVKQHAVDEKSRKVEDLERIIREFDQMASDLERQIQLEEDRTGVRDRGHFSYSTFAKAAAQRRDNLRQSTEGLREKLAAAVRERDDTVEQLSRAAQQMEGRDDPRGHRRDRPFGLTALR
ncbi:flagellar export protein FliJ [Hyphomicrobium methylovorum]|uniref:flagellar export protein FliJ n=1 Tax=Hyphomicrobium methylovorum TaxID=84 RepID=UPI0015E66EBB|nr:flagellar export protein FliJ [Hyphomicrobium methylovorum]MBA2127012.1 flagellar export protein FliJ [Hyphomicrobium methylovorum]